MYTLVALSSTECKISDKEKELSIKNSSAPFLLVPPSFFHNVKPV